MKASGTNLRRLITVALAAVVVGCGGGSPRPPVVAAGTTIVDSGLATALSERFAAESSGEIRIVEGSSAETLTLLIAGEADVAISHHPMLEAVFRSDHPDTISEPIFASEFVLVGPPEQIDALAGLTVEQALAAIAERGWTFVSRNDGSGTAAKEHELWLAADVDPKAATWRIETGQGMGATLQIADQRKGFLIAELGAFLGAANLDLDIVSTIPGDVDLSNVYTVWTRADPSAATQKFVSWLTETGGATALAYSMSTFGRDVYRPVR